MTSKYLGKTFSFILSIFKCKKIAVNLAEMWFVCVEIAFAWNDNAVKFKIINLSRQISA